MCHYAILRGHSSDHHPADYLGGLVLSPTTTRQSSEWPVRPDPSSPLAVDASQPLRHSNRPFDLHQPLAEFSQNCRYVHGDNCIRDFIFL